MMISSCTRAIVSQASRLPRQHCHTTAQTRINYNFLSWKQTETSLISSQPSRQGRKLKFTTQGSNNNGSNSTNSTNSTANSTRFQQMLHNFLGPKPMPPRWTFAWYREVTLICTVFAITGTSTMVLVRPAVSKGLGLKGSFKEGPWSYRICSLVIMTPVYATLLVAVGTIFGRHHYFRHFSVKMFSRFGIPPELMDKTFHETKKNFRKW